MKIVHGTEGRVGMRFNSLLRRNWEDGGQLLDEMESVNGRNEDD